MNAFVHEARLASHLKHRNVVQILDFGKVENSYFIAMEYVAGPTLTQIMRQCAAAAGAVPLPIVIGILCQICDALDHAHNLRDEVGRPLRIIHRDVSPSNIIVSNAGIVKLIDFGIAKAVTGVRTQSGIIKGKFAYIAPEYTLGQLDLRADLFAVGVIAHELLTGRLLFKGDSDYDTVQRLREMPIQPPSRWNAHVSPVLDDIVMTALQRDPGLRWQNAKAMRTALTDLADDVTFGVRPRRLFDWVEWAFMQVPRREDTALVRVIDTLGEPSDVAELDETDTIIDDPAAIDQNWTGVTVPASKPKNGAMVWLLLLLLVTIGLAAYDHRLSFELAARARADFVSR